MYHFKTTMMLRAGLAQSTRLLTLKVYNLPRTEGILKVREESVAKIVTVTMGHWTFSRHACGLGLPGMIYCRACLKKYEEETVTLFVSMQHSEETFLKTSASSVKQTFRNYYYLSTAPHGLSELARIGIALTMVLQPGYDSSVLLPRNNRGYFT